MLIDTVHIRNLRIRQKESRQDSWQLIGDISVNNGHWFERVLREYDKRGRYPCPKRQAQLAMRQLERATEDSRWDLLDSGLRGEPKRRKP